MFVIVGPPGAGKSSLALLLSSLGYRVAEAKDIALEKELYLAYDVIREALVVDPKICVEEVLVSTFVPDCSPLYCIYVDAPGDVLEERLRRRGYKEEKINENLEASEILRIEAEEECDKIIFVDGRDVERDLDEVIKFLEMFSN